MNDTQHAAITAYIRTLADALRLKDWVFVVLRESSAEDTYAEITLRHNKDRATIALCDLWEGRSPEEQRQTLVHELLHAHTARLCRVMTRLKAHDDSERTAYANAAFDEEEEITVDTLARVLAPFLPLPPLPYPLMEKGFTVTRESVK